VQYPLSLVSIKYKHFLLFGWGGPILNSLVWFALRLADQGIEEEEGCVFMEEKPCDLWIMQVLILIFALALFLNLSPLSGPYACNPLLQHLLPCLDNFDRHPEVETANSDGSRQETLEGC